MQRCLESHPSSQGEVSQGYHSYFLPCSPAIGKHFALDSSYRDPRQSYLQATGCSVVDRGGWQALVGGRSRRSQGGSNFLTAGRSQGLAARVTDGLRRTLAVASASSYRSLDPQVRSINAS